MSVPARQGAALAATIAAVAFAGCAGASEPAGPGLTGVLLGEDGAPLPYITVMACRSEVCYYSESGSEGRFTFLLDAPGDLLIKTAESLSTTPRWTSPMVPVALVDDSFVDIGAVHVPSLPAGAPIPAPSGPLRVETGDGLTLGFDPADLQLAPGEVLTEVAARRIPESMIPPYPALGDEEIVAVYALHPFAAKSEAPIEVRIASGLPGGTAVRFRTIDEIDGSFSDPVPGTATGDLLVTAPGSGIHLLTHLVVSR